jgi:glycerophosphoryl diester phosphodiesterase
VTALIAGKLGLSGLMKWMLRDVDAVQIPETVLGLTTTTPGMVRRWHSAGVEVHVWTINEELAMHRLIAAGVDGIVTDHCDVAHRVFAL